MLQELLQAHFPCQMVLATGKPPRKQDVHDTSTHCSLYWDGQQRLLLQLVCTNSTQLMSRHGGWLRAWPILGATWLRPSEMTVFPHFNTVWEAAHGPMNTPFPTSSSWPLTVPVDTMYQPTSRGLKAAVSPLPGVHFPSMCFTATSPHADRSSEVVTVGGVLGGVCLFVLRVWMWVCVTVWVGVYACACFSVGGLEGKCL